MNHQPIITNTRHTYHINMVENNDSVLSEDDINDPGVLGRLYWEQGLSSRSIAEKSPLGQDAVLRRMRKFGIPRRDRSYAEPVEKRFWDRVDVGGEDECWNWTASKSRGYGQLRYNGDHWKAHRMSMLIHGRDPTNKNVLHKCDNKACVNPNHLYFGTKADNIADAIERGQWKAATGCKLDYDMAAEIRERYKKEDITHQQLGNEYGVHSSTITNVVNNKTWVE